MAPAMKVTLKWEEGEDSAAHLSIKLTLPRKWKDGPTSKLKDTFVEQYNAKRGGAEGAGAKLDASEVHFITAKGLALSDADVVHKVMASGDHLRLKPGAAPARLAAPATATAPAPPASSQPTPGVSTAKAALDAAREPELSKGFDYRKWDRLDLSDEDGDDCHPNIDKESWKRLMGQKRADRREKEDEKIAAYQKKVDKYTKKAADVQAKMDAGDADAQLLVDLKDAKDSLAGYQTKLDHFLATRKLTADDLCETAEDGSLIAEKAEMTPLAPAVPAPVASQTTLAKASVTADGKPDFSPEMPRDESSEYDAFIKVHRETVDKYASLRGDEVSESYLLANSALLSEHAEGYLLLLTLDKCMAHLAARAEYEEAHGGKKLPAKAERGFEDQELGVARQHLLVQFVLTLSKGKKCDPRDMIKPFFMRTSKTSKNRVEGFEEDLLAFVKRIRDRAAEKRANGEPSPLAATHARDGDEEQYEPAGVGPGGLDPNEVLPTLPKAMQDAFVEQDIEALKGCIAAFSDEEAKYHMDRCIASGLWRPSADDEVDDDDENEVD